MSWQEKLDGLFPSGLKVIQIEDVPEGVGTEGDDSASFLTPRLRVLKETDEGARIQLFVYEFYKDVMFTLVSLDEYKPGVYLARTPGDNFDYLLTADLPEEVLAQLKKARDDS